MKKQYFTLFALAVVYAATLLLSVRANGQTITSIAGTGTASFSGDGAAATAAAVRYPYHTLMDASGNIYIADWGNNRIRKIDPSGTISTIAGNGVPTYGGDGGPATAAYITQPAGLAMDAGGNLYFSDNGNARIRKIDPSGIITTFAGTGSAGYSGNGGDATAAKINDPRGIVLDATGNLYIAEASNNVIRKINTSGIISLIAGTGTAGLSADGTTATASKLNNPKDVALDAAGNIYIADNSNHRIKMVDATTGLMSTFAGTVMGFSGDGGPATAAQIKYPDGLFVDAAGNVYFGDGGNNRVRKISAKGNIYTIAGDGTYASAGDGGAATAASIKSPKGVMKDVSGNLYISDEARIRKVTPTPLTISGGGSSICTSTTTALTATVVDGTWTSGTTATATVDPNTGVVTGVAAGTSIITYEEGAVTATHTVTVISCTGLATAKLNNETAQVIIYPNPAGSTLNIDIPANTIMTTITDQLGRTVLTKDNITPAAQTLTLSLSNVPAGNYIIKTIAAGTTCTNKLTIVK